MICNSKSIFALTIGIFLLAAVASVHASDDPDIRLRPSMFDQLLADSGDPPGAMITLSEYDSLALLEASERGYWNGIKYGARTMVNDALYIYSSPARIDGESLLWLAGITAVGAVIYIYDQEILNAIHRSDGDFPIKQIKEIGEDIKPIGNGSVTTKYFLGGLALGYITKFDFLTNVTADYLEAYYLTSSLRGTFAFIFIGRYRPSQERGPRYFKFDDGESFPSGHAANIACASRVLAHHIPCIPAQIAIYSTAAIVTLQRLTENAHWPADVFVGYTYAWFITDALLDRHNTRKLRISPTSTPGGDGLGLALRFSF